MKTLSLSQSSTVPDKDIISTMDLKYHTLTRMEPAMPTYQTGSLCEDCLSYGLQNYLKPFYINLEEQIVKCESSRCMFPYLKKSFCIPFPDSKPSQTTLNLDEFIEESAKLIDDTPPKFVPQEKTNKTADVPIMFDFSSLFTSSPVKAEKNVKPVTCAPPTRTNHLKAEEVKTTMFIKNEALLEPTKVPPKARISRCLSNVKSGDSRKSSLKKSKRKREEKNVVLFVEPESGKPMRPLDLIKYYTNK